MRVITSRQGYLRLNWKFLNWYEQNNLPYPEDLVVDPKQLTGTHTLPTGEWVEIALLMQLAHQGQGLTEVYVNGELDISVAGTNIAPEGLENMDRYPSLEIGITCNFVGNAGPTTIYTDDVRVTRIATRP